MNYAKPLPEPEDLMRLSKAIGKFPVSAGHVMDIAKNADYKIEIIQFLKLFKGDFESQADFYARTTELTMLIREEQGLPEEQTLSPQD